MRAALDTSEHHGSPDLSGPVPYLRRARAKFLTRSLSTALTEHAKRCGSPLERSYRRSIYCGDVIEQVDGKTRSHYCGSRWCLVCSRVRTARAIEAYGPVVRTWESPHLVTLTVRNVPAEALSATLDDFARVFDLCRRSITTTHGLTFVALRKIECTYNVYRDDYHPHVHVIVAGRAQADLLRAAWLQRFAGRAEAEAQDVRPCGADSLSELAKYLTKITVRLHKGDGRRAVPVAALDVIFRAMKGRKTLQAFGFRLSREVADGIEGDELRVEAAEALKRAGEAVPIYWRWESAVADWVDPETGEVLSGYEPSARFVDFVERIGQDSPSIAFAASLRPARGAIGRGGGESAGRALRPSLRPSVVLNGVGESGARESNPVTLEKALVRCCSGEATEEGQRW